MESWTSLIFVAIHSVDDEAEEAAFLRGMGVSAAPAFQEGLEFTGTVAVPEPDGHSLTLAILASLLCLRRRRG